MILKSLQILKPRDLRPEKRGRALACFLLLALLSLSGCSAALMEDIRVSSYMQKKQHPRVIRALQPETATPGEISSFQLHLLGLKPSGISCENSLTAGASWTENGKVENQRTRAMTLNLLFRTGFQRRDHG